MRAVFFCNEHFGLGHLRRSLAIAGALVEIDPHASALVVTGSRAHAAVRRPPRVETLELPQSPTDGHTRWRPADGHFPGSPGMSSEDVRALRAERSLAAVRELRPDVAVVDYLPTGRGGELVPTLEWLTGDGDCRTVLGLREIDDAAEALAAEWDPERVEAVRRHYDLAIVYGPELPGDVRVRRLRAASVDVLHVDRVAAPPAAGPPEGLPREYLLATPGGGIDGYAMLATLVAAIAERPLPVPTVMVAGPMMPAADVARLRGSVAGLDVRIERSRPDMTTAMAGATAVVAMAGYNTVAELLQTGAPALLIPRTEPRMEQLERARRLGEAGRVALLRPDELTTASLRTALDDLLAAPRRAGDRSQGARQAAHAIAALSRSATGRRRSATRRPDSRAGASSRPPSGPRR